MFLVEDYLEDLDKFHLDNNLNREHSLLLWYKERKVKVKHHSMYYLRRHHKFYQLLDQYKGYLHNKLGHHYMDLQDIHTMEVPILM